MGGVSIDDARIVLSNGDSNRWDSGGASFGCVFEENERYYLFYSGSTDTRWTHAAIGLARSHDGIEFRKMPGPILEGSRGSYLEGEAVCPAVFTVGSTYFMVFACRARGGWVVGNPRCIALACSNEIDGEWVPIMKLIEPAMSWEGYDIDHGVKIAYLDHRTVLVFYSNATSRWTRKDRVVRKLSRISQPIGRLGHKYIRRVGILVLRIDGTDRSDIHLYRHAGNPLSNLNGGRGTWHESVFCPGYLNLAHRHLLFCATADYSSSNHSRQCLGYAEGSDPFFPKAQLKQLVEGRMLGDWPGLDTPCPILVDDKIYLYHAIADRSNEIWKEGLIVMGKHELESEPYPVPASEEVVQC